MEGRGGRASTLCSLRSQGYLESLALRARPCSYCRSTLSPLPSAQSSLHVKSHRPSDEGAAPFLAGDDEGCPCLACESRETHRDAA